MTRLAPKIETLRALFAKSGNQCAFPGCKHRIINDKNQLIGEVCHIEAAEKGGERYNKNQSDEERRSYSNLILLCHEHHVETNDTHEFTVTKLKEMKKKHEKKFEKVKFCVNEKVLNNILLQINNYWKEIDFLNKYKHNGPDEFKISVDTNKDFFELINNIETNIKILLGYLSEISEFNNTLWDDISKYLIKHKVDLSPMKNVPYYNNPFYSPFWEILNIGSTNIRNQTIILLKQLTIRYLELCIKNDPSNKIIQKKLKILREELKKIATSFCYVD